VGILLDTSVILYLLKYPDRINSSAIKAIELSDGFYVSTVSLWEIAIKTKAGKLKTTLPIAAIPELIGAQKISIKSSHADSYLHVELPHKDPFDTMLIAQCIAEGLQLMTTNRTLLDSQYSTIDARV